MVNFRESAKRYRKFFAQQKNNIFLIKYLRNMKFIITFVLSEKGKEVLRVTREEKRIAYQVINLLQMFSEQTDKQYMKDEAERLIQELGKSLD